MMLDVLVVSPHPDDAEIGCGGMLLKCKRLGYSTGILCLTRGEKGSLGSIKTRAKEMEIASKTLKLNFSKGLDWGDCTIKDCFQRRVELAAWIRKLKPKIIFSTYFNGIPGRWLGHTDHLESGLIVSHAINFARLKNLDVPGEPHSVRQLLYYHFDETCRPDIVVDISDEFESWKNILKNYESQFLTRFGEENQFFKWIQSRAVQHGFMIGTRYGQGFLTLRPIPCVDVFDIYK